MPVDPTTTFCYLTTTGRRSGAPHRIEIWFGTVDGRTLYLLSGGRDRSDWVRNLQANPTCTVEVDGVAYEAAARFPDPGSDEDGLARRLLVQKYETPGKGDLDSWGRTSLVVALDV